MRRTIVTFEEDRSGHFPATQGDVFYREVKLYKIPATLSSGGHKSGEWQVSDNIFTGKLRIVAIGSLCKVILESDRYLFLSYNTCVSMCLPAGFDSF